jgi:hypothetical protein
MRGAVADRRLAHRVARVVAAIAPGLDAERQELLTRYCLWTVWLDDQLDDPDADPAELLALVDGLHLPPELAAFDDARVIEAVRDAGRAALDHNAATDVERYIDTASRDVNYRGFAYALLLMVGDGWPANVDATLDPASRAVRLANDLRTVDRDRATGRRNILDFEDRATVTRRIGAELRRHGRLLRDVPPGRARRALHRGVRVAVGLYATGDLR